MKHILLFLLCIITSIGAVAQTRYLDPVFTNVQTTTVTYSNVTNYQMDIYEPVGDTQVNRPLIIIAHGGAFLGGSKTNPTMVDAGNYFAKRGYVVASMQYTLASNVFALVDSLAIIDVVIQAVGDAKGAVRYFRQDAANANQYRIDTDKIFFGGSSAGAVIGLHLGNLDEYDVLPAHIQTIVNQYGGIEGDRGNFGYSSKVAGLLNWAGGINITSLLNQYSPPTFSAHGDADGTVPYNCGDVYSGNPIVGAFDLVDLCGSGVIHPILANLGVDSELLTYNGLGHVPWETNNTIRLEVFDRSATFLYPYTKCINVKMQLEGFFNSTTGLMNTSLQTNNLLSLTQPYAAAPYNMTSNTTVVARFPDNTVDWVLLEVRDAANTASALERKALLLRHDGMLMNIDGTTDINFNTTGAHYLALYHKSHLGVLSSNLVNLNGDEILLDFSANVNQAAGIQQQKDLGGIATLHAGDYDGNGVINNLDYNKWAIQSALVNQYVTWDGDGNGVVNNIDFNLWTANRSKVGETNIQLP